MIIAEFTPQSIRPHLLDILLDNPILETTTIGSMVLTRMGLTPEDVGSTKAKTPRHEAVTRNTLAQMASEALVEAISVSDWKLTSKGAGLSKWCRVTGKGEHEAAFKPQDLNTWRPQHVPAPYSDNPDITNLAFLQQPCIGKYNPLEVTCNGATPCPFVNLCAEKTAQAFALKINPAPVVVEEFKLQHLSHELKVSRVPVICQACSKTIPTATTVVILPGKGTVHQDCYLAYWKSCK